MLDLTELHCEFFYQMKVYAEVCFFEIQLLFENGLYLQVMVLRRATRNQYPMRIVQRHE